MEYAGPGGIMATILCRDSRPQMGSIVPGAFRKEQVPRDPDFEIIDEEIVLEKEDPVKVIRFAVADSTQGTDIAAARRNGCRMGRPSLSRRSDRKAHPPQALHCLWNIRRAPAPRRYCRS